jgi:hypothetical protein
MSQLFWGNGMVGPVDCVLDVTTNGVEPRKGFQSHAGRPRARDVDVMSRGRCRHGSKATQAIQNHISPLRTVFHRPGGQFRFAKAFQPAEPHRSRLILVGRNRRHESGLFQRAPAAFAALASASPTGVIQVDQTPQGGFILSLFHQLHQLVLHAPSRVVGNSELAIERQSREAVFRLGQQINGEKPHCQWQLGSLRQSATNERVLSVAAMALIDELRFERAITGIVTRGANELLAPAPPKQCRQTLLLMPALVQIFRQTVDPLKLNLIFAISISVCWFSFNDTHPAGQWLRIGGNQLGESGIADKDELEVLVSKASSCRIACLWKAT